MQILGEVGEGGAEYGSVRFQAILALIAVAIIGGGNMMLGGSLISDVSDSVALQSATAINFSSR